MERRQFLKLGGAAAAAGTLSPALAQVADPRKRPDRRIRSGIVDMTITPYDFPMIDGEKVYVNFFETEDTPLHPTLWVMEGDRLQIRITNRDDRPHRFAVTGLSLSNAPINPGEQATYSFAAPLPGSYLYYDPTNDPVNRLLGLSGALIVLPARGTRTPAGSPIPYRDTQCTPAIRALFDELGRADTEFIGNKWDPDDDHRDFVWVVSEVDPVLSKRVGDGYDVDGSVWKSSFLPKYFTIGCVSGFETATHEDLEDRKYSYAGLIEPEGYEGQPTMIRCLNAGLCTHSLHIHGNDVYQLTRTNGAGRVVVNDNIFGLDTWAMPPMARKDMLLPFVRPLDAPIWPPKDEKFPLRYVMHCHCEMSNTAGGGNYPQGLVTHWEMVGTHEDYKKSKGIA